MGRENPCTRLMVGLLDCQHQIKTEKCPGLFGKDCVGNTRGVGHDIEKANNLVQIQKKIIAARNLEIFTGG